MDIWRILGLAKVKNDASPELGVLFEALSELITGQPEHEIRRITGYAGLLGKVAYANMDISAPELGRIRTILKTELFLEQAAIEPIIELLGQQTARLYSVEDFVYLRLVNDVASHAEKLALMRALFSVAAADGEISGDEDAVIRNISSSLKLSHREFIEARSSYKRFLSVLNPSS